MSLSVVVMKAAGSENPSKRDVMAFITRYLMNSSNKDVIEIPTDSIDLFLEMIKLIIFLGFSERTEHIVVTTQAHLQDGRDISLIRWPYHEIEFQINSTQGLSLIGSSVAIATVIRVLKF